MDCLVRFDMGDLSDDSAVNRLIGSPPGSIGYGQGAPLIEQLRAKPQCVLLFDEIEHAHEKVQAVLLRLMSEGTVVGADGNMADARNSIIILTSNVIDVKYKAREIGFSRVDSDETTALPQPNIRSKLLEHFPAKLIDRLDKVVLLKSLAKDALRVIASKRLEDVTEQLSRVCKIKIEVSPEVTSWLVDEVHRSGYNARGIKRAVDSQIADRIRSFLNSNTARVGLLRADLVNGELALRMDDGTK